MKPITLILFLFTFILSQAQTKVIAHKSHSGSKNTFATAYANNMFNMNCSNFGLEGNVNFVLLDTVIAVNDTTTLLKYRISNACYPFMTKFETLGDITYDRKTQTIVNDKLLIKSNTVSFLKLAPRYDFPIGFQNPVEEIVFLGFKKK